MDGSAIATPAGTTSTSRSTTTAASATPKCCPPSASDAVAFLRRALAWYRAQGIVVEALLTDNGSAYRSRAFRLACLESAVAHLYTRPYTPRTNGKAERFIQTLLRQWAYRYAYPTSTHRTRALAGWLRWYNRRRPHGSLGGLPPISRVSHVRGQYS
jgi:transposase InsO family protein